MSSTVGRPSSVASVSRKVNTIERRSFTACRALASICFSDFSVCSGSLPNRRRAAAACTDMVVT